LNIILNDLMINNLIIVILSIPMPPAARTHMALELPAERVADGTTDQRAQDAILQHRSARNRRVFFGWWWGRGKGGV
jgi:hypothetical protein